MNSLIGRCVEVVCKQSFTNSAKVNKKIAARLARVEVKSNARVPDCLESLSAGRHSDGQWVRWVTGWTEVRA